MTPPSTRAKSQANCYERFLFGQNTHQIAAAVHITEAEALKRVNRERSRILRRASPYASPVTKIEDYQHGRA